MSKSHGTVRIGDIVRLQRGNTYKSSLLGMPGPVLLGLASIQRNGGFRDDSLRTYGGESDARMLLRPGDLFVSLKDVTQAADLLGAVAKVPSTVEVGRLTQDTVKLEFISDQISKDFVYWLLRTPQYRALCKSMATGTTNLGLPREDFLNLPVPIPGNRETLLCSVLDSIDSKIGLCRIMNETLEKLSRALFKSWFIEFTPVRAKVDGHWKKGTSLPGLPADLFDLFPSEFAVVGKVEIPTDWKVETLESYSLLNPEVWTSRNRPTQIRYIDLSSVKFGQINGITEYSAKEAPSRAQRILKIGDTIVGTVRPGNGSYALIESDGLTGSTGFAALRPKSEEFTEFVYLAATSAENIDRLAHLADGAAYPAVRPEVVFATPIVTNTGELVKQFSRVTKPLFSRIAQNNIEIATLTSLRDGLLPSLVPGELQLQNPELMDAQS